ncbi:alpha/beta hydrolase [Winogradskyella sediminis]|uniref:Carboxylesterase family protein n=1 Tax=Winogradskyella sediminis TaxID=1382466 RepID=A0A1H1Q4X5_9FLAO|nr:carboxylesterase family protein [Winogradskyella sediminis]REG89880.1 carboxylesterase family protein [Winogradskyella sediminis]SDS18465.1 Carboxylesterase family protein [Winogradskyella sediminis]
MNRIIIAFAILVTCGISAQNMDTYIYAIKGNDTLRLDVFTPKNIKKSDSLPVLLWMHGGGFSGSHRAYPDDNKLVKYAAEKQGYIGVSIDYRLLRKNTVTGFGCDCTKDDKVETFKQAAIDYLDAAKFLVENAKSLQIDTSKIIAGGSSAGAEGILNAVFMKDYFVLDKKAYNNVSFAGLFSCAGAVVDARYITKENAIPAVLYHGTEDRLVPFGNASHHYCNPKKDGYMVLDGSARIVEKLRDFETAYYFNIVKGAGHEIARIPFEELDQIFQFFESTMINNKVIQTKIIKTKA